MVDESGGYEFGSENSPFTSDSFVKLKKKKKKKKPCEVCGSVANEPLIMTCFKCRETREHTYCARVILQRVPRIWLCEECRDSSSIADKTANFQVKEAAQLLRTIQVEQVVVNKVSIDHTVPSSRTKQLVDNEDPIDQTAPSSTTIQVVDNGISIKAALLSRTNQVVGNKDSTEAAPPSRTNQVVPVVPRIHQYTTDGSTPESSYPVPPCSLVFKPMWERFPFKLPPQYIDLSTDSKSED